MSFVNIQLKGKPVSVHKATVKPNFNSRTVIVSDTWQYVSLWLKRHQKGKALFFWEQAKSFYDAAALLPNTSRPLPSYYFMLNASKALLISKNKPFVEQHGVSGYSVNTKLSLVNEIIKFKESGILSSLCQYFSKVPKNENYSLKDLLYNLPYIHRAYCLTFPSAKELFIPIKNARFVRKNSSSESWLCFELAGRYASDKILPSIPKKFEKDKGIQNNFVIRYKKRFDWLYKSSHKKRNILNLTAYHKKIRIHLYYINSQQRLWYLKKYYTNCPIIYWQSLILTYAAMHRLSEISRYTPDKMHKHLESRHNWLLSEFIQRANLQFLDEISSEITGEEAMVPGYIG